jgi:SMI1/KNR4 family protein SUKH-1
VITTWRALFNAYPAFELEAGCTQQELGRAESAVGPIPRELAEFLREINGVFDQSGQWHVAWPLDRIVAERQGPNYNERQLGQLLPFGDNGTGEPFCLPGGGSETEITPVYHWSFIDGRATVLAPNLRQFWCGWLSGSITT